jgi:hypothetical protein
VINIAAPFKAKVRPKPMRKRAAMNIPTLWEAVWRTVAMTCQSLILMIRGSWQKCDRRRVYHDAGTEQDGGTTTNSIAKVGGKR